MVAMERTYSVAETAYVTSLSKSEVNNEFDQHVIWPAGSSRGRRREAHARQIDEPTLLFLGAIKPVRKDLSVGLRKQICQAFRNAIVHDQGMVKVASVMFSLDEARRQIAERRHRIARLHDLVGPQDGVAGGDPVIKGTRIKPWHVADMLRGGACAEELQKEYDLTLEQIEVAKLYAQLYPRRGRPKVESRRNVMAYDLPAG